MKIYYLDIVFGSFALLTLIIWFITLNIYDNQVLSFLFLWITMLLISVFYVFFYKKSKRKMKILRIRFLLSGIPLYPVMIYFIYRIIIDNGISYEQRFFPLFIMFPALFLNGIALYYYELKNTT